MLNRGSVYANAYLNSFKIKFLRAAVNCFPKSQGLFPKLLYYFKAGNSSVKYFSKFYSTYFSH